MYSKQALPFPGEYVRYKDDVIEGKESVGKVLELAAIDGVAMALVEWDDFSGNDWFNFDQLEWDKPVTVEEREVI